MKIAFASCIKLQSVNPQPVWEELALAKPDICLLIGDNVYLDNDHIDNAVELRRELISKYASQLAEPGFVAFREDLADRGGELFATYDDHDFLGNNRCGAEYPPSLREAAREALKASLPTLQTGNDVYGKHAGDLVTVLMLDCRFYRRQSSAHDREAMLGVDQWRWLENELAHITTPFVVLASSTTFYNYGAFQESWEQYRAAFDRLKAVLTAPEFTSNHCALVISGDIHDNQAYDDGGVVEVVSSGAARLGMVFGKERRNWGLLSFDAKGVSILLSGLKARDRASYRVERTAWRLP